MMARRSVLECVQEEGMQVARSQRSRLAPVIADDGDGQRILQETEGRVS
jgi:hypothetical protein